jgi:hypothetical protein
MRKCEHGLGWCALCLDLVEPTHRDPPEGTVHVRYSVDMHEVARICATPNVDKAEPYLFEPVPPRALSLHGPERTKPYTVNRWSLTKAQRRAAARRARLAAKAAKAKPNHMTPEAAALRARTEAMAAALGVEL